MKFSQFRHLHELIRELIHPDVAIPQLSILYLVYEQGSIPQQEIGRTLHMPQGTVSRNVKKLGVVLARDKNSGNFIDKGYGLVSVNYNSPIDPRMAVVSLTDKGRRTMASIQEILDRDGKHGGMNDYKDEGL